MDSYRTARYTSRVAWPFALTFFLALILAAVLTFLCRRAAHRWGFLDRPGGHKTHTKPVALGGGVAIFLTMTLILVGGSAGVWWNGADWVLIPSDLRAHASGIIERFPQLLIVCTGSLVLHIMGLIDDRRSLSPGFKLGVQCMVSVLVVVVGGVRAGEALGVIPSTVLTCLWIVAITNAFNFLDNMDGLSAGVAAIASAALAFAALRSGQVFVPLCSAALAGSSLGFLTQNFSPARIYMGDAGSLVVGYWLGVLSVMTTFHDPAQRLSVFGVAIPIVVLAVPLYDVVSVMLHRVRAGHSPFRADRRHFSHRLVNRGMSRRQAVVTIYLATAATAAPGVLLPTLNALGAVLVLLQCACVVCLIAMLETAGADNSIGCGGDGGSHT